MPVETGQNLLHYVLGEKLGEGGMGAVWKATDTTLNREVAIKVLPSLFADDPERLARFEREAKLLASLNHPNIAAVYGLHAAQTSDGPLRFLSMELVQGEDLSKRLARGPLPLEQALDVAAQMAAGIEAAHERGVIHRDLKPANVILAPDGRVKLLDFGLAKAFESSADGTDPSLSPTMTSAGTVAGMILGTAAYMSPEQARGKTVDRRTDLWSFGCVLYECLVGRSLFAGETVSDSLAAILRKDPEFEALPPETPPMVRLLLRRCLARDPNRRLRDAGDARLELEQAAEDPRIEALGLGSLAETPQARRPAAARWMPWAVAALALAAAAYLGLRGPTTETEDARTRRVMVLLDEGAEFGDSAASPPAISPDGRTVVVGSQDRGGTSHLLLRPLDSFEARPLSGTEGANYAFWSPDSRHVGFFVNGQLRRIEIASGRVQSIGGEGSSFPRGGSWSAQGKILFAPNSNTGIWIIDASGGTPRQLTTPDPEIVDSSHRWPFFLPDGRHFLFLLWTNDLQARAEHGGVYLASIDGDEPPRRVLGDASSMAWAPSGHLLVMQDTNLMAVPFDWESGRVGGEAAVLASDVLFSLNNGHAAFSVSAEGTLVFSQTGAIVQPSSLFWYDREGRATAVEVESAPFQESLRLSPDGRRAAAVLPGVSGDQETWVVDLTRGVRTRLAPAAAWNYSSPIWSPQGDRVLYTSQEFGHGDFFVRRADGSGEQTPVFTGEGDKTPFDWSRDGKWIVYWPIGSGSGTEDLWLYDLEAQTSRALIGGEASYVDARFSPDSRWVTYASNDSGRMEIHIHRLADGARWQLSTTGGTRPHWSDDGREIVYLDLDRRVSAVRVDITRAEPELGKPQALFAVEDRIVAFDATGDHRRFLFATRKADEGGQPLHVVLDWPAGI